MTVHVTINTIIYLFIISYKR